MIGNKITEWSWDIPTEPGFYLCCYGDVEVTHNTYALELHEIDIKDSAFASQYRDCKWARLLIGSDAR